jgi:hypothetical protein
MSKKSTFPTFPGLTHFGVMPDRTALAIDALYEFRNDVSGHPEFAEVYEKNMTTNRVSGLDNF